VQRIFIKKCFLFTVGSVYRVKLYTARSRSVEKVSLRKIKKKLKWRYGSG
jgi:hypothetical protein